MSQLILLAFAAFGIWLIRRDTVRREGISAASWIPTVWLGILASRPVSTWFSFGNAPEGYEYSLEGSPIDRIVFLGLIIAAFVTLSKRRISWSLLLSRNWPVFLFYAYFLVSVIWSDSPVASAKRWFKDFGNIFVALVILTEANPLQAFRAVFVRCAYVLIPLSIIFIRYFPYLGRQYGKYSGLMEATGVTFQKNSLGAMVLVCGLVLFWDWLERSQPGAMHQNRTERYLPFALFAIGAWLLYLSDSKTSIACLAVGGFILAAVRLPVLRRRIGALGVYVLVGAIVFFVLDWTIGISAWVISSMGRDMTFTGRTDVWRELLALNTDPIFGTGFCSFWSNAFYRSKLPNWVAFSAHNGYLETYLDGGWVGIFFLAVMLIAVGLKINRQLAVSGNYALIRFAVLVVTIIGNFAESHFARMGPLWFLFLLVALDSPLAGDARVTHEVFASHAPVARDLSESVTWLPPR